MAHRTFGNDRGGELDPKSMKVLAWNIKKGQEKGLDIDLPRLAGDRDLILLSEGYMKPELTGLRIGRTNAKSIYITNTKPPLGNKGLKSDSSSSQ